MSLSYRNEICKDSGNNKIGEYFGLRTKECKEKCDFHSKDCKYFSSYYSPLLKNMICITYRSCQEAQNLPDVSSTGFGATYRKIITGI